MIKVSKAADGKLKQQIECGPNTFYSDEPESVGGDNQGPAPHDLLDAALGSCTALTLTLVARRKGFALTDVRVEVDHEKGADGSHVMHRRIELVGDLTGEQREYLLGIANKCPVHKTLSGKIDIDTALF
ncbi:OsmC family protein [Solimonas sp. SE-A11]|uniref:OsmC family protein n=1 Tax=Solimonas sp. SE-A11 TaxID=3054954 RepID=UPI00259C8575|nr:OsmC family protein [Solimonas sp. SE-A11]MDM4772770.1 OsmC family protein [Solimonas sp. SE-A11]